MRLIPVFLNFELSSIACVRQIRNHRSGKMPSKKEFSPEIKQQLSRNPAKGRIQSGDRIGTILQLFLVTSQFHQQRPVLFLQELNVPLAVSGVSILDPQFQLQRLVA